MEIITEGIRYSGSKKSLLTTINAIILPLKVTTTLDAMSGTTRVSQLFSQMDYTVISNDIADYSRVFATCYLLNKQSAEYYEKGINYLNELPGIDGWYTYQYGGENNKGLSVQKDGKKRPWQIHNTRKLDAIRREIENISKNEIERCVYLTSLILALDKVDNTLGHQVSYLKEWSNRSFKTLQMYVPLLSRNTRCHKVIQKPAQEIRDVVDFVYIDVPYGTNNQKTPTTRVRYNSYYHIWNTICKNDKPELFGKSNRRIDSLDQYAVSAFESVDINVVLNEFHNLLKNIKARYYLLSYSNNGKIPIKQLSKLCKEYGKVTIKSVKYKKNIQAALTSNSKWTNRASKNNREYFILVEKL